MKRRVLMASAALVVLCLASIPTASYYYTASWGAGCARCHQIRENLDSWRSAAHRGINCTACHESGVRDNLRRVATQWFGAIPEQIHLRADAVDAMVGKCQSCHRQEFAQWRAGPHGSTYSRFLLDREHNRKRLLMDDCLRCHGMHFEGPIGQAVQPVDTKGPWHLTDAKLAGRPAIPCLACHAMHREGMPLAKPSERIGAKQEIVRPSLALFDRRSREHVGVDALPLPVILEGGRQVRMSPDVRQSLCYQCHAPLSAAQIGSGDDRTPMGVHEGLSCLACHQKHGQATRQSCADCHPRLSNCGLDVEKMDTTFLNPKSRHDVHRVKCADCHPNGIPKGRKDQRPAATATPTNVSAQP
ncbi:MAG TPA: cytochrome c3 family protein [Candidatus Acidoferrales bacterium]|nr:cytochrome c3 family protein [Candidatus Acidoferrales bacterium]